MALPPESPITGPSGRRATDDLCEDLGEGRYRVDGRELTVPMTIADCSLMLNAFAVDAHAAQKLLEGTGVTVGRPLPGKAVLLLLGVDYHDNPLGVYREVGVLLSATPAGERPRSAWASALDAALLRMPYFVYSLPVDQEFTAHAGRFLWGYPKYLADIDLRFDDDQACVRLWHEGQPVVTLRAPAASRRGSSLRERTGYNLTLRGGQLRRIAAAVSGRGFAWRLGGPRPEIGEYHPLARALRSLGLPKRPLLSASLRHVSMRLDPATPV